MHPESIKFSKVSVHHAQICKADLFETWT